MRTPDDVGWSVKRIAAERGCSENAVKRWLGVGGWRACQSPSRPKKLDGLEDWLADRFRRHGGNAGVLRQKLATEKGIVVSLRTVERAVCGANCGPRHGRRCDSRRARASDCRSTSVAGECDLPTAYRPSSRHCDRN